MTTYVLDMNDSELRIARIGADSTDVVAQSNGFALIDERASASAMRRCSSSACIHARSTTSTGIG